VSAIAEHEYRDFAEIDRGLYVGAHPEGSVDPFALGADVVVTLTGEPSTLRGVPQGKLLVHWPIVDGPLPRPVVIRSLARFISDCLDEGAVVFVHCMAGMNRSCLVGARVLIERGMTGAEAVKRVRARRDGSLSDEYAAWLMAEAE
jgi:protein-tyrosine phosphatase